MLSHGKLGAWQVDFSPNNALCWIPPHFVRAGHARELPTLPNKKCNLNRLKEADEQDDHKSIKVIMGHADARRHASDIEVGNIFNEKKTSTVKMFCEKVVFK